MAQEKQIILIPDYLTVRELAELIEASPIEVMKHLIANGIMASINQQVDYDTAAIVAEEMGFEAQSASAMAAQAERQKAAQSQTWRQVYAQETRKSAAPPADCHHPRPCRSWQNHFARYHPKSARGRRRSWRYHAAYRRLPRDAGWPPDHVSGHARS